MHNFALHTLRHKTALLQKLNNKSGIKQEVCKNMESAPRRQQQIHTERERAEHTTHTVFHVNLIASTLLFVLVFLTFSGVTVSYGTNFFFLQFVLEY